jgi:hypothetical protein
MTPVETTPGIGGGKVKESDTGVNSTVIYCKIFCKCHNVPPVQQKYDDDVKNNNNNKKRRFYSMEQ